MIELVETLALIDELSEKLYEFLLSCDVSPKNKKLSTLIDSLEKVTAIKKEKDYYGVNFDENNVIKSVSLIKGIVENKSELPSDVLRGYYRYEQGEIYLDEKLQMKLWEE
jgi:hypothetical protein